MKPNHNTHFIVRNLQGTSRCHCHCGSWLAHWRAFTGSARITCAVLGCTRRAEVGAHVSIMDGRVGEHWWIAPLCKGCNHYRNTSPMILDARTRLVRASRLHTCGY